LLVIISLCPFYLTCKEVKKEKDYAYEDRIAGDQQLNVLMKKKNKANNGEQRIRRWYPHLSLPSSSCRLYRRRPCPCRGRPWEPFAPLPPTQQRPSFRCEWSGGSWPRTKGLSRRRSSSSNSGGGRRSGSRGREEEA
jgi:hypothetical protein